MEIVYKLYSNYQVKPSLESTHLESTHLEITHLESTHLEITQLEIHIYYLLYLIN